MWLDLKTPLTSSCESHGDSRYYCGDFPLPTFLIEGNATFHSGEDENVFFSHPSSQNLNSTHGPTRGTGAQVGRQCSPALAPAPLISSHLTIPSAYHTVSTPTTCSSNTFSLLSPPAPLLWFFPLGRSALGSVHGFFPLSLSQLKNHLL